jgi:hypothetical protein
LSSKRNLLRRATAIIEDDAAQHVAQQKEGSTIVVLTLSFLARTLERLPKITGI